MPGAKDTDPSIFARLIQRGIGATEYAKIKRFLVFAPPQSLIYFERHFPDRTPSEVLWQIKKWEKHLAKDFVLSADQRNELKRNIDGAKMFAWQALADMIFPKMGSWNLSQTLVTVEYDPGKLRSGTQIEAENGISGEQRRTVIWTDTRNHQKPGELWEKAFEELGLLEIALGQPMQRSLTSSKRPQGWFLFTQILIPQLYEFLLPYYPSPGHLTEKETVSHRHARYPKALLDDIGLILQQEFPSDFVGIRPTVIKAILQRHIARQSTPNAKTPQNFR